MLFLLPHIAIIAIILGTYQHPDLQPPPNAPVSSSTMEEWQANIQAIQNLMGAYADAYTVAHPHILHLAHKTNYTPHILVLLVLTSIPLALVVSSPLFPARLVCFVAGVLPLVIMHPDVSPIVLAFLGDPKTSRDIESLAKRLVDDDNLSDAVWSSPMRHVELYENERWDDALKASPNAPPGTRGNWSKDKIGDRPAWTKARDGTGGDGIRWVRCPCV